jgi:hypothetical protein
MLSNQGAFRLAPNAGRKVARSASCRHDTKPKAIGGTNPRNHQLLWIVGDIGVGSCAFFLGIEGFVETKTPSFAGSLIDVFIVFLTAASALVVPLIKISYQRLGREILLLLRDLEVAHLRNIACQWNIRLNFDVSGVAIEQQFRAWGMTATECESVFPLSKVEATRRLPHRVKPLRVRCASKRTPFTGSRNCQGRQILRRISLKK